jgi:hypothetical protein
MVCARGGGVFVCLELFCAAGVDVVPLDRFAVVDQAAAIPSSNTPFEYWRCDVWISLSKGSFDRYDARSDAPRLLGIARRSAGMGC